MATTPYIAPYTLYKDILDYVSSHAQVKCVHFGWDVTDIPNPKDATSVSYPYVFFLVNPIQRNRLSFNPSLSMIVMTQVQDKEDDILQAQSDMFMIGSDIVAHYTIVPGTTQWKLEDGVQAVPFVAKYNDTVSGVTFDLSFEVNSSLSTCYIPISS